jgi:hypothetical protein
LRRSKIDLSANFCLGSGAFPCFRRDETNTRAQTLFCKALNEECRSRTLHNKSCIIKDLLRNQDLLKWDGKSMSKNLCSNGNLARVTCFGSRFPLVSRVGRVPAINNCFTVNRERASKTIPSKLHYSATSCPKRHNERTTELRCYSSDRASDLQASCEFLHILLFNSPQ